MDKNTFHIVKKTATKIEKSNAKIYPYASEAPLNLFGVTELNVARNGRFQKLPFHQIEG